ncbi:uncharacterized protein LOC126322391 [Schistocerca gregaria]|uniref:uncharacterized protein LOC126322391 n=1 Tax=Schistocerca gregaria TaxID=7010 RepID=UPI00211EAE7D|nr:uncharacterized protein LOC126322391 [Schistocerca gregaria]
MSDVNANRRDFVEDEQSDCPSAKLDLKKLEALKRVQKSLFQKQQEEAARKKREEEEQNRRALEDAIQSFDVKKSRVSHATMMFVSGGVYDPGNEAAEGEGGGAGQVVEYRLPEMEGRGEKKRERWELREEVDYTRPKEIDSLLEELKREHQVGGKRQASGEAARAEARAEHSRVEGGNVDVHTTNLWVGNISSVVTPEILSAEFSQYGQVLSSKVMVPLSGEAEESGWRKNTSGFVLFARREDAELAKKEKEGTVFYGTTITISWAKAPEPAKIARLMKQLGHSMHQPALCKSPGTKIQQPVTSTTSSHSPEQLAQIPAGMPTILVEWPQPEQQMHIDSLAEQVARHGDHVEKNLVITARQSYPSPYSFLLYPGSLEHIYYSWRLYTLRHGETLAEWNETPFQMFVCGPFWVPPLRLTPPKPPPPSTVLNLIPPHISNKGELLLDADRRTFENMLRPLTLSRKDIKQAMIFALTHCTSAPDIVQILTESLLLKHTRLNSKIARLFLLSDILYNAVKSTRAHTSSYLYSIALHATLPQIFHAFSEKLESITGRITRKKIIDYLLCVLDSWKTHKLYPEEYVDSLKLQLFKKNTEPTDSSTPQPPPSEDDIDGVPISPDDLSSPEHPNDIDGVPIDDATLRKLLDSM